MDKNRTQTVRLAKEWPLPYDPTNLRTYFAWGQIEDETCKHPAHIQENSYLRGHIILRPQKQGNFLKLSGEINPLNHPLSFTPINGHNNGMIFQISCMNLSEELKGIQLWSRYVTKKDIALITGESYQIQGIMPGMPYNKPFTLNMTLGKTKSNQYVSSVSIEIPLEDYEEWLKWWSQ